MLLNPVCLSGFKMLHAIEFNLGDYIWDSLPHDIEKVMNLNDSLKRWNSRIYDSSLIFHNHKRVPLLEWMA
jgi:hypothetical protein